jgi:hypothetical protein
MTTPTTRTRALVTGASSGIGEGFARRLAQRGHDLTLVARRRDRLEALASELQRDWGASSEVVEADLATDGGVGRIEERVRAGDIGLLVNNAGFGTVGEFAKLPLARELEELDLNVRALVRLSHAALGPMLEQRRGAVINVASTAAFQAIPYNATYAATKAYVLHFSEALHEEVKPYGVTVTCLCPGPVKTEYQQVAGIEQATVPNFAWTTVDRVVDAALAGAKNGRAIVIPGGLNTMMAMTAQRTPRFLVRRMAGSMFRNRTRSPS